MTEIFKGKSRRAHNHKIYPIFSKIGRLIYVGLQAIRILNEPIKIAEYFANLYQLAERATVGQLKANKVKLNASSNEYIGAWRFLSLEFFDIYMKNEHLADSSVKSAGYLYEFTAFTTLNLSHTLSWNCQTIAEICRQMSTLVNLNLTCNRFVTPTNLRIVELSPAFNNPQLINLRN
uniref:Uncharacterized protein n=1 Tax=Glossina brevipalpis TaxID=37001 RepID=A0A1A9WUE2_9MUSC